jgi:hypothetical protein
LHQQKQQQRQQQQQQQQQRVSDEHKSLTKYYESF